MNERKLEQFLIDSNAIEREVWDDLQMDAIKYAMTLVDKKNGITTRDILKLHKLHERGYYKVHPFNNINFGSWRCGFVYVGNHIPPNPEDVPCLMKEYCKKWNEMDAYTAHCEFEKIHPFDDLNGRVGRLLWLIKAIESGYNFRLSFLHTFYYQTLAHYENQE